MTLVDSDSAELQRLKAVAERVNAHMANMSAGLKGAYLKVFELENTLNSTLATHSMHDRKHEAFLAQLLEERSEMDAQLAEQSRAAVEKNEEIEQLIGTRYR